jgi:isoleucyl-tRNA synthetase
MLRDIKKFNLPDTEKDVLKFWKRHRVFERSLEQSKKKKTFRFFEGPPTANGRPGTHHVLSRAFKDIILRYKTMRGFFVLRRAGWDTHGLPVEIEIEKELGLKKKSDIEKFGIEKFNERARQSVWKYKTEWEALTERVGFWLDFHHPYITYESSYIESLWWIFSEINKKGYLKKLRKVIPWCPRCQTPLSNNELAQPGAYKKTQDPSLFVKFRLKSQDGFTRGGRIRNEYVLVWTTTPWTLPANMSIAANPKLIYTKYKIGNDFIWSYSPPPSVQNETITVVEKLAAHKLIGREYEPLFKSSHPTKKKNMFVHHVIAGDFIGTEEGTGFVHIAPAFGEEDFTLYKKAFKNSDDRPEVAMTITENGKMIEGFPGAGKFIKDADNDVVRALQEKKLIYLRTSIEHEYPFCWRCSTPLIYFARLTWFIEMSKLSRELTEANSVINWIPKHIKTGRFGEWLKEARDWSISRERFWGTPLPIWEGENCNHRFIASSFQDLTEHAYNKNTFFLVRHGEADHNVKKQIAAGKETTANASHLTKRGISQIEKLGKEFEHKAIDFIITSPFTRTQETAKILARYTGAKVIIDKGLREVEAGVFNHKKVSEYHAFYKSYKDLNERFTQSPQNGENFQDITARMVKTVSVINRKYNGKRIIVVSHGDPLWLLLAATQAISKDNLYTIPYLNVGMSREIVFPNFPFDTKGDLDWHRPFVDEIVVRCPQCDKKMRRIKEVADAWFDSGAMPFAQWHYPFENKAFIAKKQQFPADYIAEGIDQTRGWFYTLLAISVLLGRGAPYKNVISMGLVLDKEGQKMSKSRGNAVNPWGIVETHGADVLRWYLYTINNPGDPKRFDERELGKVFRRMFMILYNSYLFLNTYKNERAKPIQELDNWILARLHETIEETTKQLDQYLIGDAARKLEEFIGDLSRWYIRRSRKNVSPKVLQTVLIETAKLLAPFTPFFAESLYQSLAFGEQQSVHLTSWTKSDKRLIKKELLRAMEEVRELVSDALALREKAGIRVRQPLASLTIKNQKSKIRNDKELIQLLKDEINVKEVIFDIKAKSKIVLNTVITPELHREGVIRELARMVQKLRQDAGLNFKDTIKLSVGADDVLGEIITEEMTLFKSLTRAKIIYLSHAGKKEKFRLETQFEGKPLVLSLKKTK